MSRGAWSKVCPHGVLGWTRCKPCIAERARNRARIRGVAALGSAENSANRRKGQLARWPDARTRLMSRRIIAESGCWEWTGCTNSYGYGVARVEGRGVSTHRLAYEIFIGPIPDGLVVDHKCGNRKCFNPEHLRAVTQRINSNSKGFCAGCGCHVVAS